MLSALSHIDCWIFDLDNTLYPARCDLFGLIDRRMTAYVARVAGLDEQAAFSLQKRYFREHGTTLSGMMADHGVDPHEFLADVHAIEMDVLARLGLSESFEAIHDIHATAYRPKPHAAAYASMLANLRVDPTRALFAEDMARNLRPAKALGLTTLWVDNGSEQVGAHDGEDFIDYRTADLGQWLESILEDQ